VLLVALLNNNMDTTQNLLQLVDADLRHQNEDRRSESVRTALQHMGVQPDARLNYRPSPGTYLQDNEGVGQPQHLDPSDESYDLSFRFLRGSFGVGTVPQRFLGRFRCDHGIHFLTYLDAYAALPEEARTHEMTARANAIEHLLDNMCEIGRDTAWRPDARGLGDRGSNCGVYTMLRRLVFYRARSLGVAFQSLWDPIREDFHIPEDFDIDDELLELRALVDDEEDNFIDAFNDSVKLEWASEETPLSQFTRSIADTRAEADCFECTICADPLRLRDVLTKGCRHPFWRDCLRSWAYACHPNSHTCPTCRRELFAQPTYRPRGSGDVENYADQLDQLRQRETFIYDLQMSNLCFEEELKLQQRCENGTASSSTDEVENTSPADQGSCIGM